jgi:hypothetical protein
VPFRYGEAAVDETARRLAAARPDEVSMLQGMADALKLLRRQTEDRDRREAERLAE